MNEYIQAYISSKQYAWSESTKRSELRRLVAVKVEIDGNPETLWNAIESLGPYSRLTLWTRVTQFYQWMIDEGKTNATKNEYRKWRETNARLFKNVYQKHSPNITFSEAEERIKALRPDIHTLALQILHTGVRFNECASYKNGEVDGKGGKRRAVYLPNSEERKYHCVQYETFRLHLAKVGLRPHDLRKIFISRLVELGASEFDLCQLAGWASINTASSYVKINETRLRGLVSQL